MKTSIAVSYLVLACALSAKAETKTTTPPPAEGAVYYTWHDAKGRAVEAAFQGMEGSSIVLQTKDGSIYPIALEKLQAADRELAKKLQSEILAKETNTSADKAVYRIWHDTQGHTVDATFRGVENGNISLQTRDGVVALLPLERLTKEDQEIAKTLKPAGLGIPVDRFVAEAASKIDEIVNLNLKTKGEKPNALASDEQFVRRVYLDLVGRIPTREETVDFLGDASPSKRAKVID